MMNIEDTMAEALGQNFDELGAISGVHTKPDGTATNIKLLLDNVSMNIEDDSTGEIELWQAEATILKDANNYGIAAPQKGEKITVDGKTWLIVNIIESTSFDTRGTLRCDIPKSKQSETRIKKLK